MSQAETPIEQTEQTVEDALDQVLAQWADPPSIFRGAPFWSWNSRLDPERLCRQIRSMHGAGMGGFFMHSRYGLKTPYLSEEWFECIRACIDQARELDMKAYLYDEDRWPSGSAGGLITRDNEEFRLHILAVAEGPPAGDDAHVEGLFAVELDQAGRIESYEHLEHGHPAGDGRKLLTFEVRTAETTGWYNDGTYLDTMNPEAVEEFIHITHQAYADRFGKDFGPLVPAIFTDEPNYGNHTVAAGGAVDATLQWTPQLPREFIRRRGYDLRDHLPELVLPSGGEEFSKVRHDYRRTLTELFAEAFSEQIGRWCGRHGIALTGHMLREQTLASQVAAVGAAMPHYEHMQWPGIDILCDQCDELSTARQCTSVADQLGRQRVLTELYGCTGWDWPLEGHKFVGDWQYAVGVNFRCPHLSHYSLAGGAKRDYPASILDHSPWWKYYRHVEDYFARLGLMLTRGRPTRDVLVIHPIESAWGLCTPPAGGDVEGGELGALDESLKAVMYALSGGHYDWDFGDESLLARHAKAAGGELQVGQMSYRLVIVPPSVTLRATTVDLLARFVGGGGLVLFLGRRPDRVDGEANPDVAELADRARCCGDEPDEFIPVLAEMLPRRVSIAEDGREQQCTWAMVKGGQLLFVQSHDRSSAHRVRVAAAGRRPVVLWDARTGDLTRIEADVDGDTVAFELDLPATGSALVSLGLPVPGAAEPPEPPSVAETRTVEAPYPIELAEPNTLPLDYCAWRLGEEEFSEPTATLKADELIRKRFGLGARLGREHQPWYLYAMGTVDTSPRGPGQLRYAFHVTDPPAGCGLAVEGPGDYEITVNGAPAGADDGFWVDEDIRKIDITALVRPGRNEVLLSFDYRPDMELEDLYLVGDFGVSVLGQGPPAAGNMTLVTPPRQLDVGSWVGQGLDFYGGAVMYKISVQAPPAGKRVRIRLDGVACTAAALHVGAKTFVLPWPPFAADVTDALSPGDNEVIVEVIGGRKNILGPLHTPREHWTGPAQFDPNNPKWRREYYLTDHGLTKPILIEILG